MNEVKLFLYLISFILLYHYKLIWKLQKINYHLMKIYFLIS